MYRYHFLCYTLYEVPPTDIPTSTCYRVIYKADSAMEKSVLVVDNWWCGPWTAGLGDMQWAVSGHGSIAAGVFCCNDEPWYCTMSRNKTKSVQCEKRQIVTGLLCRGLNSRLMVYTLKPTFSFVRYTKLYVTSHRHNLGEKGKSNAPPVPFQPKKSSFFGYWLDGEEKIVW